MPEPTFQIGLIRPAAAAEGAEPRWLGVGRRAVLATLAGVAFALSCYLSWVAASGGTVAGCGGEIVDCDTVLATRWNQWFGVNVALLACGVYGSLLAGVWFLGPGVPAEARRGAWGVVLTLATAAGGAALWFISLQVFAIGKFCAPCLATHGCGLALAGLAWWWGVFSGRDGRASISMLATATGLAAIAVASLVAGQLIHQGEHFRVDRADDLTMAQTDAVEKPTSPDTILSTTKTDADKSTDPSSAKPRIESPTTTVVQKPPLSRMIHLHKIPKSIDAYEHPILGSPDAEHVMVKLFDYTCHHCRDRHFQLEEARKHFGDKLAILVLPVPMNRSCNRYAAPAEGPPHGFACAYARLAISVWATDRTKFAEFHHWMFVPEKPPTVAEANAYAKQLVGKPLVEHWKQSEQLSSYVSMYGDAGRGQIPKLIDARMMIDGEFSDAKQLIDVLEKEWSK